MKSRSQLVLAIFLCAIFAKAQADPKVIQPILSEQLQSQQIATYQLQQFLEKKVPVLPTPTSAAKWTAEAQRIREHLLNDVIFHGWPKGVGKLATPVRRPGLRSVGKGIQVAPASV
jgi:hypothetical protein